MDFTGSLVLPIGTRLERPIERDGSRSRTIVDTAAAIPALIRVQDDRRLTFIPVGYVNVHLADFHTMVTPIADLRVKNHRSIRGSDIG